MIRALPLLAAVALAGCSQATTVGTKAVTDAQIAAYGLEGAYTVAAHAEVSAAAHLSPSQIMEMKQLDQAAYTFVQQIVAEAKAGAVIEADLVAAQQAVAGLSALVKGN